LVTNAAQVNSELKLRHEPYGGSRNQPLVGVELESPK